MSKVLCNVCSSKFDKIVCELKGRGKVYECENCSFLFCDTGSNFNEPVHTPAEYIENVLYNASGSKLAVLKKIAEARNNVFVQKLGFSNYQILEIGCGTAEISEYYAQLGVDYIGIDVDEDMVKFASNKKYKVQHIDFMDYESGNLFDVITLSHTLEHIPCPADFIKRAYSMLKPGGIIHCDVPFHPNMNKFINRIFFTKKNTFGAITYPHHLFAYNQKSMGYLFSPYFDTNIFVAMPDDPVWGNASIATMPKIKQAVLRLSGKLKIRRGFLVAVGKKLWY